MESIYVSFQGVSHGGKIKVKQEHVSHLDIGDKARIVDRDEGAAIIGILKEIDDSYAYFDIEILN